MTSTDDSEREALVLEHTRRWQQAALQLLVHSCPKCDDPGGCMRATELLDELAQAVAGACRAVREADKGAVHELCRHDGDKDLGCAFCSAVAAIEALERQDV